MSEMNLIEKIKIVLGLVSNVTEHVMGSAVTDSGANIQWEGDLEVGKAIFVVTEEGSVPAPSGEHILSDGTKLILDENGVVSEIVPAVAEQPAEEVPQEMSENTKFQITPEEQTAIVNEVMQILEPRLAEIEKSLLIVSELFSKNNAELMSKIEKLSAEPATEPIKTNKFHVEDKPNALKEFAKKIKK